MCVGVCAPLVVQLPDDVSDEAGLLLGDILSTAFFCAERGEVRSFSGVTRITNVGIWDGGSVSQSACRACWRHVPVRKVAVATTWLPGTDTAVVQLHTM